MPLRNRNNQIPNGFKFKQPQIPGWSSTPWLDFTGLVAEVIKLRRANPGITQQYKLSTDPLAVAEEVDTYNTQLCRANGWNDFIYEGGTNSPKSWTRPVLRLKSEAAAAGDHIRNIMGGLGAYVKWVGKGGRPVAKELAESRASICVQCPQNQDRPGWLDGFTEAAAREIRSIMEVKNNMELKTSHDDKLHVCAACDCPLKSVVWSPIEHKLSTMSDKALNATWEQCWIRQEKAGRP